MKKKKCCVIGLGYIGLPTSIVVANSGFDVIGVDKNLNLVDNLNKEIININEPNLEEEFKKVFKKKIFRAQIIPCQADIFIIAVPTPFKKVNSSIPIPDTSYVLNAIDSIMPFLKEGNLIILESTSPVGTTEKLASKIFKETSLDQTMLKIAYCPERVLPGNILQEIETIDRVIGGFNELSSLAAKDFYSKFSKGNLKLTNSKTAELVKLTENSFRDVNIAFANELSMICSKLGINTNDLIDIANCHPRVNILRPSPGVGGHCIAVDPWFIVSKVPEESNLIRTAREVNDNKTKWTIGKIKNKADAFEKAYKRKPLIGCFGLTFKPNIEDIRESASIKIVKDLIINKYNVICCDPNLNSLDNITLKSFDYLIKNCDLLVLLVAHNEFKDNIFDKDKVLDFCNITK